VPHDRYRLNEFNVLRNRFPLIENIDQQQLGNLLRRSDRTFQSSNGMDHLEVRAIPLHVQITNSSAAHVGRTLFDLDIELRRTSSFLNESLRPIRGGGTVEVVSAEHTASLLIVVGLTTMIYNLLTSRPVDFLQLMAWLWDHRLNWTKSHQPYEEIDSTMVWRDLLQMATDCVESGQPVVATAVIDADGFTRFGFQSH
jgi:hypothetical protein